MTSLNRVVMNRVSTQWVRALGPEKLRAAEISGTFGKRFDFASYRGFRYPKFDICAGPFLDGNGNAKQFDIILANQVWEHLDAPVAATLNVFDMLAYGGYFWVAVPFMIPFHAAPNDCSRWSARGLKNLLVECGFRPDKIRAQQWGNRQAALRNMEETWPPEYQPDTDDLTNDPDFPILSWAMAQK